MWYSITKDWKLDRCSWFLCCQIFAKSFHIVNIPKASRRHQWTQELGRQKWWWQIDRHQNHNVRRLFLAMSANLILNDTYKFPNSSIKWLFIDFKSKELVWPSMVKCWLILTGVLQKRGNYPRKISVIRMIKNAFPVSETLLIILYPVNFSKATYKKVSQREKRSISKENIDNVNLGFDNYTIYQL